MSFPEGYPAYCIYIPSGFDVGFEKDVVAKLEQFGISMEKNLFVAPWNVGDPSYVHLINKIGLKRRPAIILTDSNSPDRNSFMIILERKLIKDLNELIEVLPSLVDLILQGDKKSAIKESIQARRKIELKLLTDHFSSILKKIKVTFSWNGITIEPA
jgi:hypothetical protein